MHCLNICPHAINVNTQQNPNPLNNIALRPHIERVSIVTQLQDNQLLTTTSRPPHPAFFGKPSPIEIIKSTAIAHQLFAAAVKSGRAKSEAERTLKAADFRLPEPLIPGAIAQLHSIAVARQVESGVA